MSHLETLTNIQSRAPEKFQKKLTGHYYTHKSIAINMFESLLKEHTFINAPKIRICDPFAGDGRLVVWLIELCVHYNISKSWEVYLFDINQTGLLEAELKIFELQNQGVKIDLFMQTEDVFKLDSIENLAADLVVTNPPWAMLKPDTRYYKQLDENLRQSYISNMKNYDLYLAKKFPTSQPKKKFAGWGTNLSRVGVELSHRIIKESGYCCIVLPASFFADYQSGSIRRKVITESEVIELSYYPAEANLFDKADVASATMIYKKANSNSYKTKLKIFNKSLNVTSLGKLSLDLDENNDYMIPITIGSHTLEVLYKLKMIGSTWGDLETNKSEIWSGREIDETKSKEWLSEEENQFQFVKGRMIQRFAFSNKELLYVHKLSFSPPESTWFRRIVWRDVSRPSQKRRVIATIIPEGVVAGNSLGVVYYKDGDEISLLALLGIMNSLSFEFQLRFYLATGHVSLSSLRKVYIPEQKVTSRMTQLADLCYQRINDIQVSESKIEALVAHDVYKLTEKELILMLESFEKLTEKEKDDIMFEFNKL